MPIRPIRVIRFPSPDPLRTQTGAGTPLPDTAGAPAAGFQGSPPLLHGVGILIHVI
ncbi:MAG TPA: hypothetical protein VIO11_08815 [Candidatus Methanoperedens sp.]